MKIRISQELGELNPPEKEQKFYMKSNELMGLSSQ